MNNTHKYIGAITLLTRFGALENGGRIIDVGGGYQGLRNQLPETGIIYTPVDIEERVPGSGTIICNLNNLEFPFFLEQRVAAFCFLGSFEYILAKMTVLHLCRKHHKAHVVMHYQVGKHLLTSENRKYSWVAPFSVKALEEAAAILGYDIYFFDGGSNKGVIRKEMSSTILEKSCSNGCAMFIYFIPK